MKKFEFGNRVFIIAEVSGNHNGSYETAEKIVRAACEAGVDAVKLQTYPLDEVTIDSDKKWFQVNVNDAWKGRKLIDLYKLVYTPWEWQEKLKRIAEEEYDVLCFSTPFGLRAVDFLEQIGVQAYKIASFEIGDLELLKKIGETKKPVIFSTGLANLDEIELAYKTLKDSGCPKIGILYCISSYPADPDQMNLSTLPNLKEKFPEAVIGLSDHTLTTETAVAGVAFGAKIIEKHITLRRSDGGPDSGFSLEPQEFKELVRQARNVEKSIGKPTYGVGEREKENLVFKRSLFIVKDIRKGEIFTRDNVKSIRPGYGLAPKFLDKIIGRIAREDIERGTPISWDLVEE
jgi:pseudaminic acid synthase